MHFKFLKFSKKNQNKNIEQGVKKIFNQGKVIKSEPIKKPIKNNNITGISIRKKYQFLLEC